MTLHDRLILENQILSRDGLSQFKVYQRGNSSSYYLTGLHNTNSGNPYELWSPIPAQYPDTRPSIYVNNPNPLPAYTHGKSVNVYGISHAMHTLSNGPSGQVQICHWRSDRWHSGITLNKVMIKALIWLEAYEQYRSSGSPIHHFVRTMS